MRVTGILLFALLLASPMLSGQAQPGQTTQTQPGQTTQTTQPGTPQRTPARPLRPGEVPPKGSAVIKGQVLAGGAGTPVRRAQVRAMSMEGRGGGVTSTDAQGNYEIKDLAAGRYSISVVKGGFANLYFGQRRPGDPGTPIELADGQTADKVNFVLSRGGVISGTIVDDGGEPVSSTNVTAMRFQYVAGTRRLMPAGAEGSNDRTDDRGTFRLYGLPPGEYFISASNRNNQFMGPGMASSEQEAFAPTYYPGTANIGEATRVTVRASQEVTANFALIVARMARVRGRALSSRGDPLGGGMAMLAPADPFSSGGFGMNMMNAVVAADGAFEFANVPPGRYNLNIRPGGMPNENTEFALMPLTIGNDDVDNVIVTTHVGAIARGVVMTDDGSAPSFRPEQVQIFPATIEPVMMGGGPNRNRVNEDFTFEMTGLSDRRVFRGSIGGMNSGWFLTSVIFDGQEVIDTGIDFMPGRSYEGIQIVFSRKTTDLSGLVTDDRGKPVLDATVVVFPGNRDRWMSQSRYIRTARPDTTGRYNIKNLPPADDYLVIAVQNLESGQGTDPEFLAKARDEAKSFSLGEGETKAVDIRLSPLVP
ncbi:MAG TPA: carboxypeptidase-like regulatory domain-containing protein [Vicinamibacterales bacterium]|nr:carboxypeptidase-like regulatory domain-containing protein [Vicinamibacterales bacterium]